MKLHWELSVCVVSVCLATIVFATDAPPLTLKEAITLALQRHPNITIAELKALAAQQVNTQTRAALFPNLWANATAVGTAGDGGPISAGALNTSSVYDRMAAGLGFSQLITDFGRSSNLAESSKLHMRAEQSGVLEARAQLAVQVATAFFSALQAQAVRRVAEQTIAARQLVAKQVETLAENKIKSDLDVSFAQVTLHEARLLAINASNDVYAAFAALAKVLAEREASNYRLIEQPAPPPLPMDMPAMIAQALRDRPELVHLRLDLESAHLFAKAEKALDYPTLNAVGAAGVAPLHDSQITDNYAAAGLNLTLPLFNGRLNSARQAEAETRARIVKETLNVAEINIIQDVRSAWFNVNKSAERLTVTAELLKYSKQAAELAQAKYQFGASSIIEFSQAQLNLTAAEIAHISATFDYQIQRAILNFQIGGQL